jgi:uncharacterized protein YbjQ (UPF0145 family)
MDPALVELVFDLGFPLTLIVLAFFVGQYIERRHYADIRRRERENADYLTVTFAYVPVGAVIESVGLVVGSVVVSLDHFKRFLAGLRSLVGGPVRSYESLLDRARREAILRMQKAARDSGFDAVVNVRLETARLVSTWRRNQRTAGVEVLAFGTGLKLAGSGVSGAAAVTDVARA